MIHFPTCMEAHWDTARLLWQVGNKSQALVEYRLIARASLNNLMPIIHELKRQGAAPVTLESFATPDNQVQLATGLVGLGLPTSAKNLLLAMGDVPGIRDDILRAQIALQEGDLKRARESAASAELALPHNPESALLLAQCDLRENHPDDALALLREAARYNALHIEISRLALAILASQENHAATERAILDLRAALVQAGHSLFETHLAAAALYTRRGSLRKALSEYQTAIAITPSNVGLWLSLANLAQQMEDTRTATHAFQEVLRLDPTNTTAKTALSQETKNKKFLETILRNSAN